MTTTSIRSLCVLVWLVGGCAFGAAAAEAPLSPRTAAAPPAPEGGAPAPASANAHRDEKLVITGDVTAISDDVSGLLAAIDAHAEQAGGSVAREEVGGDAQHRQATVVLRLPPAAMAPFVEWVAARAELESRHVESTEVTRQYFDRDLAIRNLEVTMSRLEELARRPDGELKDVLEIEREMTRVRGQIEALRGEQRLLGDQIARATLTITVRMHAGVHTEPELKFELVPHLALLHLADAGARAADRAGLGASVMFSRALSLDFETLAPRDAGQRSYLFTLSAATYSDFLGGGRRRFGNPYLGLQIGGARLDGLGAFAYGAEAGVELVRVQHFLLQVSGRALGLWYNRDSAPRADVVLEGAVGIGVPF
jgi:hypothetical protein